MTSPDLRDFPYMPLDVVRLRDSAFAATTTGDEFRAGVFLWCASWHQLPAGTLPVDDASLAHLAGYGRDVKGWKKVREGALHGWTPGASGRLEHQVIAEKVADAWQSRIAQRARTEAARKAREVSRMQRVNGSTDHVTDTVTESVTDNVTGSKGSEAKGRERREERNTAPPPGSEVSPRTRAAAASGGGLARKVSGISVETLSRALEEGSLPGVVQAFGGALDGTRPTEWARDAAGLQLGVVAAILRWCLLEREPVRQPSGFRAALTDWRALAKDDRTELCNEIQVLVERTSPSGAA